VIFTPSDVDFYLLFSGTHLPAQSLIKTSRIFSGSFLTVL